MEPGLDFEGFDELLESDLLQTQLLLHEVDSSLLGLGLSLDFFQFSRRHQVGVELGDCDTSVAG